MIKTNLPGMGALLAYAYTIGDYCRTKDCVTDKRCWGLTTDNSMCMAFTADHKHAALEMTPEGPRRCKACMDAEMPEGLIYKKTKDDVLFRGMWRSMNPTWPGWPIIAAYEREVRGYMPEDMVDAAMVAVTEQDVTLLALSLEKKGEVK